MCTFEDKPKLKRPKGKTFIGYKVFGTKNGEKKYLEIPHNYNEDTSFRFGKNIWNLNYYNGEQAGFQVFKNKKDAKDYGWDLDKVCPVVIKTEDIVKMTNNFEPGLTRCSDAVSVYEVSSFNISKKDWEKA